MDSRTADKFVIRMPDGLRERIAEVARASRRSMNSEILYRLASSLAEPGAESAEIAAEEVWTPHVGMLVETSAMEPAVIARFVMHDQQLFAALHILRPDHHCEAILPLASLRPCRQRVRTFEG